MGSSASEIVSDRISKPNLVNSITLSDIVSTNNLTKVDFIKCDIEGGELAILKDKSFFNRFKPKMIIETHFVDNEMTTNKIINGLREYGYTCRLIKQEGDLFFPLVECEFGY